MVGLAPSAVKGDTLRRNNNISHCTCTMPTFEAPRNPDKASPPAPPGELALREFSDALTEHAFEIESTLERLTVSPENRDDIGNLFRALHNIKGEAALCGISLGISIAHPIESLLSKMREGTVHFSEVVGETILLAIDRLELATEAMLQKKPLENLQLPTLIHYLESIAQLNGDSIEDQCRKAIEAITGFPGLLREPEQLFEASQKQSQSHTKLASDLLFFRSLGLQLEQRSSLFKGRTLRILRLALETNKEAGSPIPEMQLEAAIYLHDIGMMFLPDIVWLKAGKLSDEDRGLLSTHPGIGAGILERLPGWFEAAKIIAQHHEMPDGKGYPAGAKDKEICAGAKLLAIIDAFEAVMLKHIHRGKSRSVLRAIAEINACEDQFAREWIDPFNRVIRKTMEH